MIKDYKMKNNIKSRQCFNSLSSFCLLVLLPHSLLVESSPISSIFQSNFSLSHLTMNNLTGAIYVGGENRLFQISENLEILNERNTGPRVDNVNCYSKYNFSSNTCADYNDQNALMTTQRNNQNQILSVDVQHNQLVACGTLYHGACMSLNLTDISIQIISEVGGIGSNDPYTPMIGTVAQGPTGNNVLYVATASNDPTSLTYIQTQCKSGVCSLSLSSQSKPFQVVSLGADLSAPLTDVGLKYNVTYVASFDINGYTYFFTRQPTSVSSSTSISKIIQVCQQDKSYDSYVETQILCDRSGSLVQAGTFLLPGSLWANQLGINEGEYVFYGVFSNSSSSSSVCFYPLKDIRKKFTENIECCYNGSSQFVNFYYTLGQAPQICQPNRQQIQITDTFCGGFSKYNSPLNGTVPLYGTNLNIMETKLTAIRGTAVNNYTVLFLGTEDGQILKYVLMENGVKKYDSICLGCTGISKGNMKVNQDMVFSRDMTHIYAMTQFGVYKVRLFECEKFTSCGDCLSSGDPFCGWCTLESRCSSKPDCQSNDLPGRWVFPVMLSSTASCPAALTAVPSKSDVNLSTQVILSFLGLPTPKNDEYYTCFFGSSIASSRAVYSTNQLQCQLPKDSLMSVVGYRSINLTFAISSSNVSFLSIAFTLYNCSSFTECSSCTGSLWSCHWCISSNACQNQDASCSSQAQVNAGSNDGCPRILSGGGEVLIPSGSQQDLLVKVANIPSLVNVGASNFKCKIMSMSPPATVFNNTHILCSRSQYISSQKQPTPSLLKIVWGSNEYPVEGNYSITVYNCSAMSEGDCSICLSLGSGNSAKFNCLWCQGDCQPLVRCTASEKICPKFTISGILPSHVPKDGNSPVTISGINLGSEVSQVKVKVNGVSCNGIPARYMASRQYVFIMNNMDKSGAADVTITVTDADGSSTSQTKSITVTDPVLSSMTPVRGPESGGSLVTLIGTDLQSGSNITVEFGNTSCIYDNSRSNDTHLLCVTTRFDRPIVDGNSTTIIPQGSAQASSQTAVMFDSARRTLKQSFEFTANPTISPILTPDGSFERGGCMITVTGTNLDKSSGCAITVVDKPVNVSARNLSHIIFISPMISKNELKSIISSNALFQLDAVNLMADFKVYPDPSLSNVSTDTYSTGSTLYLKGSRLNTSCMQQEVVIKIGSKICNITAHTHEALYCTVPALSSSDNTEVVVTAGQNLVFYLGRLTIQGQIPWAIAVGVIGGISLVIIVLVVLIFVIKRSESKRRMKKLSQQLELLERNVRDQCRLAFSELQTEVSDFNSDLEKHGIPFWDFKTYAFRLLFPKVHNHPVLTVNRNSKNKFGGFDEQMQQFNQLLSSQVFILTFIDVLDKQLKAFSINDRAKVSSLLGVILLNRMEFATDIIKELLGDLIKRSVEKKSPKLMLRSTESLVEKLLANWLSLSMFEYLRDSAAGNALFMLHKALKHQMEKGPIDAVTAEARNTLSEDRLLRENIEPTVLNLTVFEENRSVACKMLSSDSISQAKEKALDALYKNIAYSKRPSLYDANLAWKTGTETVLQLSDEDSSSVLEDGWKRINTLEHYRIPDESCFVLSRRSATEEESMETVAEYMSQQFGYTLRSSNASVNIWHLVKHEDNQNSKSTKVISEIFLTRLLSTKMIMDKYIKDLFEAIFQVDSSVPPVVKYLYDFLDEAAQKHNITDYEVVHAWKSNSLLLRFWVNVITNPAFVFDISKSNIFASCLAVVAQAFIDSCSTQELHFGKDSPSTKLLFAKDIPGYQKLVQQFFTGVRNLPRVSDEDMEAEMVALSKRNKTDFNLEMALRDLYSYADKFQYELMVALSNNPSARRMHLLEKFQDIQKVMHPE